VQPLQLVVRRSAAHAIKRCHAARLNSTGLQIGRGAAADLSWTHHGGLNRLHPESDIFGVGLIWPHPLMIRRAVLQTVASSTDAGLAGDEPQVKEVQGPQRSEDVGP
jgi:hypothetical protein